MVWICKGLQGQHDNAGLYYEFAVKHSDTLWDTLHWPIEWMIAVSAGGADFLLFMSAHTV